MMGSSSYLNWKGKEYIKKLTELRSSIMKQMSPEEQIRTNTILNECQGLTAQQIMGHDLNSSFFVNSVLFVLSNVILAIQLLKNEL